MWSGASKAVQQKARTKDSEAIHGATAIQGQDVRSGNSPWNEEMTQKNIELSAEFSRYLFEHPEVEATLPADAEVVLLPEMDAELSAYNQTMGHEMEVQGEKVIYVRLGRLRPKVMSRIESLAVGA